jgi:hypothetical protein
MSWTEERAECCVGAVDVVISSLNVWFEILEDGHPILRTSAMANTTDTIFLHF